MDVLTNSLTPARSRGASHIGWVITALAMTALAIFCLPPIWRVWRSDPSLSHGPLVPFVAAGLLWIRRDQLRDWRSASPAGLSFTALCVLMHLVAVWADIVFLKPLTLIGILAGVFWFLGGLRALIVASGALGFLLFMIPWPTVLVDKISFPLQLTSSSYATIFGGVLGLPLHREGVQIEVLPNPLEPAIYSVIVGKECSGLTSLMVLLALGYLTAGFTRANWAWRLGILASLVPMALFVNAIRLTVILWFGARVSTSAAQWVHDNEGPVLMLFCGIGLLALRSAAQSWTAAQTRSGEGDAATAVPLNQ